MSFAAVHLRHATVRIASRAFVGGRSKAISSLRNHSEQSDEYVEQMALLSRFVCAKAEVNASIAVVTVVANRLFMESFLYVLNRMRCHTDAMAV